MYRVGSVRRVVGNVLVWLFLLGLLLGALVALGVAVLFGLTK